MFTCKLAQDEVTHQRLQVGSTRIPQLIMIDVE
jgi:hypothetical protein